MPRWKSATDGKWDGIDTKVDETMSDDGVEDGADMVRLVTLYKKPILKLSKSA